MFVDGMYVLNRLALTPGSTVYVTVRVTNGVNNYTVVPASHPIVISPQPILQVTGFAVFMLTFFFLLKFFILNCSSTNLPKF